MNVKKKRISAKEMVDEYEKLTPKEQERLYYMMQGVALVSEMSDKSRHCDGPDIHEKVAEQL